MTTNNKPTLTAKEKEKVLSMLGRFPIAEIVRKLGTTRGAIRGIAYRNRRSVATKNIHRWSESDVSILKSKAGSMTARKIGELIGVSRQQVHNKGKAIGVRLAIKQKRGSDHV